MKSLCLILLAAIPFFTFSQDNGTPAEFQLEKSETEAHLRFLASDELQGRRTGEMGNNIAARYIATQFEAFGLQTAPGLDGYFQPIAFEAVTPPRNASLSLNKTTYTQGDNLLILTGNADNLKTEAVFVNFGWVDKESGHDDYQGLDVKGKIVFSLPGTPDGQDPMSVFNSMKQKRKLAQEKGAVALIELYRLQFPWPFFRSFFDKENLSLAGEAGENSSKQDIVYGWVKEEKDGNVQQMQEGKKVKASLMSKGFTRRVVYSQNVIGIIEGIDPELRDEYLLLTAHYDHVGTGKNGGGPYTPQDSIFNGARDNGMGTVALISAAKALSIDRPRRSVIVLAVTGEELGLLGSKYYSEHPLIPLNKTIFNLNSDGAGYNDVSYVSVVGFGRTGTDALVEAGVNIFGMDVFPNPAPEQNLYDRSDNVSFASKGVPAIQFVPGTTGFDEAISKYYHQVTDNPDTIDYDYLHKFCQAFARTARLIANENGRPQWAKGDKYEKAGMELYGDE
ncbi:MAG: M28 family peptidase [Lewinellaceae bacterium]|nr:M28 family peptidase [Phaeodactylibacter sp.]MCB0613952.1 M28 family peptidase [Phaeodactylibacter sp.]MCB9351072.1 M28 family peptidase [Lewinellaceae bacterium]